MFRLELIKTLDVGAKQNIKTPPLQSNMVGQHQFYNTEVTEQTNILPRNEKGYSTSSQHPQPDIKIEKLTNDLLKLRIRKVQPMQYLSKETHPKFIRCPQEYLHFHLSIHLDEVSYQVLNSAAGTEHLGIMQISSLTAR